MYIVPNYPSKRKISNNREDISGFVDTGKLSFDYLYTSIILLVITLTIYFTSIFNEFFISFITLSAYFLFQTSMWGIESFKEII